MKRPERTGLGRGLSTLLGEGLEPAAAAAGTAAGAAPTKLPVDRIDPNPEQPRRTFREEDLEELAASISARGIIQPLVVRPDPQKQGRYQIVAGERRWRAAQKAQVHEVPVVVREIDDRTVLEIALVENVQRVDLNAIEEAQGYAQLSERFGYTQEELAGIVGKSRSHIANLLRLLALPDSIKNQVRSGTLSAGHARALATAADPVNLAREVILKNLNVRQTEDLARSARKPEEAKTPRGAPKSNKDADTRILEQDLSAALGVSVTIDHRPDGSGKVTIAYREIEQLDQICAALNP